MIGNFEFAIVIRTEIEKLLLVSIARCQVL